MPFAELIIGFGAGFFLCAILSCGMGKRDKVVVKKEEMQDEE